MKKEIIGGFTVKELPKVERNQDNKIVKCWCCGNYLAASVMAIKDNKYYCNKCQNK